MAKQVKVLLIEDNPGDARLVIEALAEAASPTFKVSHVSRFVDGLQLLDKQHFDVVLLDLMLEDTPRMGTLMHIYARASKVPIVVLTGLEDEAVGLWVLQEGAQDYLVKGKIDSDVLRLAILDAMERHRTLEPEAIPSSRRAVQSTARLG